MLIFVIDFNTLNSFPLSFIYTHNNTDLTYYKDFILNIRKHQKYFISDSYSKLTRKLLFEGDYKDYSVFNNANQEVIFSYLDCECYFQKKISGNTSKIFVYSDNVFEGFERENFELVLKNDLRF